MQWTLDMSLGWKGPDENFKSKRHCTSTDAKIQAAGKILAATKILAAG